MWLGRYYLKKIEKKELTCKQVAAKLEIPEDVVEKEYQDFKNPFNNKKAERRMGIIQIVLSIISAGIVLFTLFEMQAERDMAYRPDVYFTIDIPAEGIQNIWNDAGELIESNIDTFSVPIQLQNIGVGTAKNIYFDWKWDENLVKYAEVINRDKYSWISFNSNQVFIGNKHPEIEDDNKREEICHNETPDIWGNYRKSDSHVDYLMNSNEKPCKIWFPTVYFELVQEAVLAQKTFEIPDILLDISYYDIQGKKYQKTYQITPNVLMWSENGGDMTCQLSFDINEVKKMGIWDYLSRFSDLATAITAILALLVSIVALKDSHKYSRLQKVHNEKSVKPIAAILQSDYENRLAVSFKNVGTGPLIVKKMLFKSSEEEKSILVEMIHSYDGLWNTFFESLDGEVLPAGEKLCLLELERDFEYEDEEEIRNNIRRELADITVTVEYEDIYGNPFTQEKKLDLFGRHFS